MLLSADTSALLLSCLCFVVGLLGSFLPIIPGNLIVWLGILSHRLWLGEASVSWLLVCTTGFLTLSALLADCLLGLWGAKRFGASKNGLIGALIGAIIGLFIPPPLLWLILGPLLGAIVGELTAGKSLTSGSKAGLGALLGSLLAFIVKFALSLGCIVAFFLALQFN
jgi:uncharacterized protein YqgC (DUF456 family)